MTDNAFQSGADWLHARTGKVTASRMADVLAKTKAGYGAARGKYLTQLVTERLTGRAAEFYVNPAMQWGSDQEPNARAAYEFMTDATVALIGFVGHPTIPMSGASPDGLVGDSGLVEFKCPTSETHIETILNGEVPAHNVPQIVWQMACTGRTWCDFVSYDPRLPANLQFFRRRIEADPAVIKSMEAEVVVFLKEVDAKISALKSAAAVTA